MKFEYRVTVLAFLCGILLWVVDAVINSLYFYKKPFLDALILAPRADELYDRILILIAFTVFGIVLQRVLVKRRQAQEMLRSESDFSKGLVDTAQAIILTLDPDGRIVGFNPYMEEITGYKLEEVKGKDWFTTFLPECDHKRMRALFKKAIGDVRTKGNVNPILAKDGREVLVEWYDKALKDADGKVVEVLSIGHDVTERERAQRALRESEDQLRALFENASDGILLADLEAKRFHQLNHMMCDMLGYTRDEILNLAVSDIHPKDKLPYVVDQFERQVRGELSVAKDIPVLRKDGSVFYADVNSRPVTIAGKSYLLGIFRDVTERREMEEVLRQSEEKFRGLFEFAPDGYYLMDEKGVFVDGNRAAESLVGYERGELIGRGFLESGILRQDQVEHAIEFMSRCAGGECAGPEEFMLIRKDGPTVPVEIRVRPMEIGSRRLLLGIARDVTDRKVAEKELQKKMNELTKLNELMVGREDKVLELKGEINALLKELGRKHKYGV